MTASSQPSSRDRLVASAVQLLRKKGYAASGVSEIASNGPAPMGSFYHYFPQGKEQLAADAIEAGAGEYAHLIESALAGREPLPEQLAMVATLTAEALQRSNFELGCPVATTALETITTSAVLQDRSMWAFTMWHELISQRCIAVGITPGGASALATMVIALIEGAELLVRVQRNTEALDIAADAIRTLAAMRLET